MTVTRKDTKATARGTAPLKVDAEVDELITDGAHFLGMTKKDLVGEAVRVYLELRKAEVREAMLAKLRKLDGSVTSSVALLTGLSSEDIDRLGGITEKELGDGVRSAHLEDTDGRPSAPASTNR
jgi:hypothetical protein